MLNLNKMEINETGLQIGDQRLIQGETYDTPELHNVSGGVGCILLGDRRSCFKRTRVDVLVPNDRWVFIGIPYIEVVQDNQGSAAWNMLDRGLNNPTDRFFITLNNPNEKRADVLSGSRRFKIRLVCLAKFRP